MQDTLSDRIVMPECFPEIEGWIDPKDVREFISDIKEFLESAAEHGEGCRCPMRMNKYAKNAILSRIDKLAGYALVLLDETGGKK